MSIKFQWTFLRIKPAPVAAMYRSRGPSLKSRNILKSDVLAPRTRILAAYVPTKPSGVIRSNVRLSSNYNLQSGTSMACPHASSVATLLKGKFDRTVMNVGDGAAKYKAKVVTPAGSEVIVSPATLVFGKKNEKLRMNGGEVGKASENVMNSNENPKW
ncbi:hypothetical protein FEM48_Zijuj02G0181500 [Ziziphus jujuba var. spinosa]|uniref:Subtilisin-like protease fibronectin type-III domain-containing protein n=1 Tax=Ziziphus jujuba var. spinosa TaxID=714518 RepID=A0A978VX70_ZIZJJ|nr:hypothetical protein FEM48_Zijuj02G0181500 [Ziziphus jujuba var. spinosa]